MENGENGGTGVKRYLYSAALGKKNKKNAELYETRNAQEPKYTENLKGNWKRTLW